MNNLTLIKSENFERIQCDFWQDENKEIWVTREQIGKALGYADPDKAIANIHDRNRDRLDKFSTILSLRKVEGNREVSRQIIAYNYKDCKEVI
jgi:prophage antirepressor-like protein